jgi:hypothetical protein
MEKKREGDREAAGEVFYHLIPYITVFLVLGMRKGSWLKLLLPDVKERTIYQIIISLKA